MHFSVLPKWKHSPDNVAVLSSSNPTVKLQVYELLCAVSLASPRGHDLALDALQHFKVRPLPFVFIYLFL
jgi:hypothetical protein